VPGCCEHGNDNSGSMKGGESREYLHGYYLFKKNCSTKVIFLNFKVDCHRFKQSIAGHLYLKRKKDADQIHHVNYRYFRSIYG
jgi:hypothetical protein